MIINNGPIGISYGNINPVNDILLKFNGESDFHKITFSNSIEVTDSTKYLLNYQDNKDENTTADTTKWYLKILEDCNLKFNKNLKCELFLVSGGHRGKDGTMADYCLGGDGGDGGKILTVENYKIKKNINLKITIGIGETSSQNLVDSKIEINNEIISSENDENSEAATESRGKGGAGAISNPDVLKVGGPGQPGKNKFGYKYGAGGGGGGAQGYNQYIGATTTLQNPGAGGKDGGGTGANPNAIGNKGSRGSGSGGGGQYNYYTGSGNSRAAGDGGSGTIIISNY